MCLDPSGPVCVICFAQHYCCLQVRYYGCWLEEHSSPVELVLSTVPARVHDHLSPPHQASTGSAARQCLPCAHLAASGSSASGKSSQRSGSTMSTAAKVLTASLIMTVGNDVDEADHFQSDAILTAAPAADRGDGHSSDSPCASDDDGTSSSSCSSAGSCDGPVCTGWHVTSLPVGDDVSEEGSRAKSCRSHSTSRSASDHCNSAASNINPSGEAKQLLFVQMEHCQLGSLAEWLQRPHRQRALCPTVK